MRMMELRVFLLILGSAQSTPDQEMSSQVRLKLLPRAKCMYDDLVQVKVSGLKSRQVVAMRARSTDDKREAFSSSATYRADGNGEIELNTDASLCGSYYGVEPMGLLWSMRSENMHKRFQKTNSSKPHVVKFSVHEVEGRMLAEVTNERLLMGDGVSRVPVSQGNVSGILFTPPGEGPFPAVLDISTLLTDTRASLLASKGFVVLAVTLFTDYFPQFIQIHLDHYEEAVNFLQKLPKVGSKGVGVISRSKAADVALSLSAFVPGVEAVVWINGCSANAGFPLYYKKKRILPALMYDNTKMILTESGAFISKYCMNNPLENENRATLIPIEQASSRFLFVASEDDLNWDSKAYMDQMVKRLNHHGKENFKTVSYPRAGHLLNPPYEPFCPSSIHGIIPDLVLWGGEPSSHAAAEVHMWKKIQGFFKTYLTL